MLCVRVRQAHTRLLRHAGLARLLRQSTMVRGHTVDSIQSGGQYDTEIKDKHEIKRTLSHFDRWTMQEGKADKVIVYCKVHDTMLCYINITNQVKHTQSVHLSTYSRPKQAKHRQAKRKFAKQMTTGRLDGTEDRQRLRLSSYYRKDKQTKRTRAKQLSAYHRPTGRYKGRTETESVLSKGVKHRFEMNKEAQDSELSNELLVYQMYQLQLEINIKYNSNTTQAVPAVSMVIKHSKPMCAPKLNRLVKTRQSLARRPREPRRALVTYSRTKTQYLRRKKKRR